MCVIIHKPLSHTITQEKFHECWARNSHGLGFYTRRGEESYSSKGLMEEGAAYSSIKEYLSSEWETVIHFRIQSRGGVCADLTHPFSCGNQRLLFHNGTVKIFPHLTTESDTSALSKLLKNLSDKDVLVLLKELSANGQGKFVFVDNNGDVHIYGDSESKNQNGIWYSNTKHENHKGTSPYYGDGWEDYHVHDMTPYDPIPGRKSALIKVSDRFGIPIEELEDFLYLPEYIISDIKNPTDLHRFLICE